MSGLSDAFGGGSNNGGAVDPTQSQGGGVPWAQVLLAGVSGAIDSQLPHPYSVAPPVYNTAGGVGGQAQGTRPGTVAGLSPTMLILAIVVIAVVILLVKK